MAKKILTVVLTVLLLAGVLFGVCYYVGRRNRHEFAVRYNGEIVDNLTGLAASTSEPLVFTVSGEDYTVTIVPSAESNLVYEVNNEAKKLSDLQDCTAGFQIDTADDGTVTIAPRGNLKKILSIVHDAEVVIPDDFDADCDLFTVVFKQEKTEYRASFCSRDVYGVKLSESEVKF